MLYQYKTFQIISSKDDLIKEKSYLFYEVEKEYNNKITFKRDITIKHFEKVVELEMELDKLNKLKEKVLEGKNIKKVPFKVVFTLLSFFFLFTLFLIVVSLLSSDYEILVIYAILSVVLLISLLLIKLKKPKDVVSANNIENEIENSIIKIYEDLDKIRGENKR